MFNELDLWNLEKQQASLIVTYRVFETCDMPTQGWSQRRQAFTEVLKSVFYSSWFLLGKSMTSDFKQLEGR